MRTTSLQSLLLSLGAAVALLGCPTPPKPPTVVPKPPTIEIFASSATVVDAGGRVTLQWRVTEATSVELREASTGPLDIDGTQLEGSRGVDVSAPSLFVLTARGPGGSDARAVSVQLTGGALGDVTFRAIPPVLALGESTTLTWTAPGARAVSISAGGQALDLSGQREAGAVRLTPSFDTTYTLTADTVTRSLAVEVQPGVTTLRADPPAAVVGQAVTLSWTAGGAEKLVISSPGRGTLQEVTNPSTIRAGTFTEPAPALPVNGVARYVVTAVKGAAELSKWVEVAVGTDLAIASFSAPPVASAGAPYTVRWATIAAATVEVEVDGLTVYRSATQTEANAGVFSFTAPQADFTVELVAHDGRGASVRQLSQVDAVGVPTAATLTASPTSVAAGQPVTLTFAAQEARRVRISDSSGQLVFSLTGQAAESGTATVYPNASTTYSLSADNMLGNPAVTATADVTVTGTPVTVTQSPPTAIDGQNVTLTPSTAGAVLYGFPHGQIATATRAAFIDISDTGEKVLETGGDVTQVTLPFSTWLYGVRQTGPLTVSRAGWMAWRAPLSVLTSEFPLPSTSAPAFIVAPFWDDLRLTANSGVFVQVVGDAPEQTLIVQWNKLQVGATTATEVTFQAQVHQTGTVAFHYETMTLPFSTYASFTTGVQDGTRRLGLRRLDTPASDSAVYFFSPVADPIEFRAFRGGNWGGFVKVGTGYALVSQPANAIRIPQDLGITEYMLWPSLPDGQYLELLNRTILPMDLSGWVLGEGASAFSVPDGFTVVPGAPAVIGASSDPELNDDAGVSLAWGSFSLALDGGTLRLGTLDASVTFAYAPFPDAGVGVAIDVDPQTYAFRTGTRFDACPSNATFGSQAPPQQGSPGVARDCGSFPYAVQSIIPAFRDISQSGSPLFATTGADQDDVRVTVLIADAGTQPMPLVFGEPRSFVDVSTNGWMSVVSATTAAAANKSLPTAASPIGTIAPFWDDLETRPSTVTGSNVYWQRFSAGEDPTTAEPHWVFQWHRVTFYNTDPADDLNFQVKLFDSGRIEYHYGELRSGTTANIAEGGGATVWLENPAGTQAAFLSINQPLVQPNSAYRFSPR